MLPPPRSDAGMWGMQALVVRNRAATRLRDLARRCQRGVLVDVGHRDLAALAGEGERDSLPMPLAAPVTMQTLSWSLMVRLPGLQSEAVRLCLYAR